MVAHRKTVFVVGVFAALAGCSSGVKVVVQPSPPALRLTSAFVYPVQLAGTDTSKTQAQDLTQRLIDAALASEGERFAFFGPTEFTIMRAEDDGAWVASTALPVLLASGSKAEQGVVLRAFAERRVTSGTTEAADTKGRRKGAAATEDVNWVCRVEILHPSSRLILVETSGAVTIDPFAEPTPELEFDPAAPMTHLLEKLTVRALRELRSQVAEREPSRVPTLSLAMSPAVFVGLQGDDGAALTNLARMDAVQAELFLQARARYLTPTLTESEAVKLAHEKPGLLVREAPTGAPFKAGDFLEAVDNKPALPQALSRSRFMLGGVTVRVRHADGSTNELPFP